MMEEKKALEKELEEIKWQLKRLKNIRYHYAEDIYAGWVVLVFLHNPEAISDDDFDKLVEIMNGIRLTRLGKKPKQAVDAEGKIICQCQVPMPYTPFKDYGVAMDEARQRLAKYLVPLLKDEFVPRFEYKQAERTQALMELYKQTLSAMSGYPGATNQPVDKPGPSEQKTTPAEMDTDEKADEAVKTEVDIPKEASIPEVGLDYWSPEAVKARWEADKEFSAKVGPRIDFSIPWKADQ